MKAAQRFLAIDLGAESGRAVVGAFDGARLTTAVVHRFPNVPVRLGGTLYWDLPRLFGDCLTGIRAAHASGAVASVGVDAWGVDFGLLDGRGRLLGNPVHYRDQRTRGMLEHAARRAPRESIYAATGIQLMPINTLYQLLAMVESSDPDLERAERLLMIPDLLHHFLCGTSVGEYTNATTTQCYDVQNGRWAKDLLHALQLPVRLLPDVVPPGTRLGPLAVDVADEVGQAMQVVAPATHDTASAVAATPLARDGSTAYLSSGTWSLVGIEVEQPILSDAAREGNLTNEGGVNGTVRLLKNVMGLWLVQQARAALARGGAAPDYDQLTAQAAAAPAFSAFIDPDDERYLRLRTGGPDLPAAIQSACVETGQDPPTDAGTLVRVIMESLALQYASVLRQLETASGRRIATVHVIGGGSNNALLCQMTADACERPVLAGPVEATAIGNLLVQAMAAGEVGSLAEARDLVAACFPPRQFDPVANWSAPRERFAAFFGARSQPGVLQS